MLSIFDEGGFSPCPAPFNLAAHVLAAGQGQPNKEALLVLGQSFVETWTYGQITQAVLGIATGLVQNGLRPGDYVLLRLGNTVDFPLSYLGALAAGMMPVPTSAALTARETQVIVDMLHPSCVLHDEHVPCPDHETIVTLNELRKWHELPPAEYQMGDPDRTGYVVFTSGTSGQPRAVAHAHRAIWARQMMFDDWYGLRPDDRVLHAGAFNWTYTLGTGLMDPWTRGATALIPEAETRPGDLVKLLVEHRATIFAAAPGVYRQMLKEVEAVDLPNLRHGLSAGEKLPEATVERWRTVTGRPVFEAFGMSECSTFISQSPSRQNKPGRIGRPQHGRRIALLRDGAPVPHGEEGTIAVHQSDPGLMLGYIGAQEATKARMSGEWFLTGDQAIMHPSKELTYMGRHDDVMNAGGYRVSPLEVEKVINDFNGISGVAVTEVEVKTDTTVIAAFYTAPATLDEQQLHTYVAERLARYKQPRLFIHVPEIPTGANGKILRNKLRARFKKAI